MFVVLTASNGVSDAAIASIAAALGDAAEAPRRLSATSAEIRVRGARPDVLPVVSGIDVNIVPAINRRKKLLIADMDSTIINVECIDELADFAGKRAAISAITERAMRGELGFEQSLTERVMLLKGVPVAALEQCYATRISLNPGARVLVQTMNAMGAFTALVSGGFTFFSNKVGLDAGFSVNKANELLFQDGQLTGEVTQPILGQQSKLDFLNGFCEDLGITLSDTLSVGDGANDLSMIEAAGLGVAYHAKPSLKSAADVTLDHSDLTALLALQGIADTDYVS